MNPAAFKPVVLFGGTFDPVHNGHVAMVNAARQELAPERQVALPAGNPYQRGRLAFADATHRTRMLEIAFRDDSHLAVDPRELYRAGPTYTVDTLREWRAAVGDNVPLVWLLGSDAFARLDTWHQWQALFDLAHFAVVLRQDQPQPMAAASATLKRALMGRQVDPAALEQSAFGQYALLSATVPAISSTGIRALRGNNESIRGLVPDSVCDYIDHHQLYLSGEQA